MPESRTVPPETRHQIQNALNLLLYKEPLPSYAVLGLDFVVHAGVIKRIKTKCEIQIETTNKEVSHEQ